VRNRAVVSVIGRDQKGVVARISTYLASCNTNIEDIEQRVMEGLFIMTMLVDLSDLSITLDELVMGLRKIGEEINMETTLRLAGGPPERKRVAVLVTKEPHCLVQLVQDRDAGVLNGDLLVVLANHPDLEPLAREHRIPFAWAPSTDKAAHAEFVTEQLDAGPVILQDVFHIRVGEDALEDVKARGRALEAKVLSQAVQLYLNDQLVVKDKKVIFRPGRFPGVAAGGS